MLASAIPFFTLAVSWSFWFFFDRGRALRDTTAVAVVSSNWHRKLLYHFISHALSSTSILSLLPISISLMLVTMVLKRGSLLQWFGMLQLVERRMVTAKSAASNDSLPNHTRAGFPGQALILIFLSLCWRAGRLDRSSWHHSLADCRFGPLEGVSRRTWFNVEAEDYLERRTHPDGLRIVLSEYL